MHLIMIAIALAIAWGVRLSWSRASKPWTQRWQHALFFFLFPPLLLLATAVAVLCMGTQGKMLGLEAGWLSYLLALNLLGVAGICLFKLLYQGWSACQNIRTYPQTVVAGKSLRVLEIPFPYSAQIGFWQPELVITQGLLETLDSAHLQAVLAHEQAHADYHDTFWFLGLGWLRSWTCWLPHTEALWQELLLLRELRADRQAAQSVNPLFLAEAILEVARAPLKSPESFCAPLSCAAPPNRLQERIEALLNPPESLASPVQAWNWSWILLAFLPLVTVPLHS